MDVLVSELMIHVNATWGRMLADRGYDALYRNQKGAKTRMEVTPGVLADACQELLQAFFRSRRG